MACNQYTYDFSDWRTIQLPLPYPTLLSPVRFRFLIENSGAAGIDNVYIGECFGGCSGHGHCTGNGCRCTYGYYGKDCSQSVEENPTYFTETFSQSLVHHNNFIQVPSYSIIVMRKCQLR